MGHYNHNEIELKWQQIWREKQAFSKSDDLKKPKFYILDMFPYPSGSGLHVGHPLGYIATDIVARYKRLCNYNVLHPMGYDAFGLPAENYAIATGTHPAYSTEKNISRYRQQLNRMGLAYTPDTELRTSDPDYYKWTQWIFLKLFNSWYDKTTDQAQSIEKLVQLFEKEGNSQLNACTTLEEIFTQADWALFSEAKRQTILLHYRLAYLSWMEVNWCPALGTVLANEEVKDGVSERGGHPVFRVPMRQWSLRIVAYAERLLAGLNTVNWPSSVVEMQKNWIGRSTGAYCWFEISGKPELPAIKVFTTRPDTLFGVTFLAIAPEHSLVEKLTDASQQKDVSEYCEMASRKSERDRIANINQTTGVFTGSYATHPITKQQIPIWIADYVLSTYGTGAIMAVPAHDARDFKFAKTYHLPIIQVIQGHSKSADAAYEAKEGILINSGFLNEKTVLESIDLMSRYLEDNKLGKATVQYRFRDPVFSRQRYWGEPFPIVYRDDIPYPLPETDLPVRLPDVQSYKPAGNGESPLANVVGWINHPNGKRETNTMPGWAGSSWYFLRYIDVNNKKQLVDFQKQQYWMNIDLYVGGAEHAVGHLLYARFWTKFLYDIGSISFQEPFQKLVNQGMILGNSAYLFKKKNEPVFVSKNLINPAESYIKIRTDASFVQDGVLDVESFKQWLPDYQSAVYETDSSGKFYCHIEVEKMSKTFYNVVNPDQICEDYGADTLRMFEMFLGPLEQTKPWSSQGISGVYAFLKRLFNWLTDDKNNVSWTVDAPTPEELRILHSTTKKVAEDIEKLSFNTCVSQFMIALNELIRLNCRKRAVFEPLLIALSPFAPHITAELWERAGHTTFIHEEKFPMVEEKYLQTDTYNYPVSINGKVKFKISLDTQISEKEVREFLSQNTDFQRLLGDKSLKKIIYVPGKIINVVV